MDLGGGFTGHDKSPFQYPYLEQNKSLCFTVNLEQFEDVVMATRAACQNHARADFILTFRSACVLQFILCR